MQLVGFQEEVQLREQDWGNFQVRTTLQATARQRRIALVSWQLYSLA